VGYAFKAIEADSASDLSCVGCVSQNELNFTPGTINAVTAGTGLTGGGTSGSVTLNVDTTTLQGRVSSSCAAGASIRQINSDGSVTCQTDTNSGGTVASVGTGPGLTGGPITTSGTLSVNFAGPGSESTAARSDHNHQTGTNNTAIGNNVLTNNTGSYNNAIGNIVLTNNTGDYNTGIGYAGLMNNTGSYNIAIGLYVLNGGNSGNHNTAVGSNALSDNTTGYSNTAIGSVAQIHNTTGIYNTAIGSSALVANTTGKYNTAVGQGALLFSNSNGNTAIGNRALQNLSTGIFNTAIGRDAGVNAATGDWNIYIGPSAGPDDFQTDESFTIRLGAGALPYQQTLIQGIYGSTSSDGLAVYINSAGKLGTLTSSRRFKEDIQNMGDASVGLMKLRPVTFRYKAEVSQETRTLQYGLLAEEVAEVYPELVQYDKDGVPYTVRYHLVNAMLLNEVQKQYRQIQKQDELIRELYQVAKEKDARIQKMKETLEAIEKRLVAVEGLTKTTALK
jgi:hypothetical protein